MELKDRTVLVLGGAGLVGFAVARQMAEHAPRKLVLASLRRKDAEEAARKLEGRPGAANTEIEAEWGDLFVQDDVCERPREEILGDREARGRMVDDPLRPPHPGGSRALGPGQLASSGAPRMSSWTV